MHTKARSTPNPYKQWEVHKTINQQLLQQNTALERKAV